jgi:hypothetical protein
MSFSTSQSSTRRSPSMSCPTHDRVIDVGFRCRPRLRDESDRRRLSMSSSISPWSDRLEPSAHLGCPSVARRRSRRRLRNAGRQPSMELINVDHRACPPFHGGKPTLTATRSAVSPSGATDGHPRGNEGSNKSLPGRWEWSTWTIDLVLDPTTASRLSQQPVPQSPLRGRLTGTRGGSEARTSHCRSIVVGDKSFLGLLSVDGRPKRT